MQDQIMPNSKWTFNGDVTAVFDDMLERSIPQYNVMRQACTSLACKYAIDGTAIVDLGCSRGEALAAVADICKERNSYIGCDVSQPMLDASRKRFRGRGNVTIAEIDLRLDYPPDMASVTLAVLTLQFTPIEYRQKILSRMYAHTVSDGVVLLVEKVLGATAELDEKMVATYYEMKAGNGYSQEQIERKRLSLEGVLVPVTARWNEDMLMAAGFKQVDCFWRWMNFAGWVAVKAGV